MKCIIVDDEPIAREGVEALIRRHPELEPAGSFDSAEAAAEFMARNNVDLVFLDIEMPGTNGLEFARAIPKQTLVIFTTAYSEYALDSYETDAVDYLVKPIDRERFGKAVRKATAYHALLADAESGEVERTEHDFIFVRSERRYFKVCFKDILFVEGLKDYVVIQTTTGRIITKMYLRTMHELLPARMFFRISRSYVINLNRIDSFDNNDVFIGEHEIGIGSTYRDEFFRIFMQHL